MAAFDFSQMLSAGQGQNQQSNQQQSFSSGSDSPAWLQSLNNYYGNNQKAFAGTDTAFDYKQNSQMSQTASGGTSLNKENNNVGYTAWRDADSPYKSLEDDKTPFHAFTHLAQASHALGNLGRSVTDYVNKGVTGTTGSEILGNAASMTMLPMFPLIGQESRLSALSNTDIEKMNKKGELPDYKMTGSERIGTAVSSFIDLEGVGMGGSGTALAKTAGKGINAATKAAGIENKVAGKLLHGTGGKGIVGSALESKGIQEYGNKRGVYFGAKTAADALTEGSEEFVQSIAEDQRNDRTNDGQMLNRALYAGAIGAGVGGVMSAGARGIDQITHVPDGERKLGGTINANSTNNPNSYAGKFADAVDKRDYSYIPKGVRDGGAKTAASGNTQPLSTSGTASISVDNSLTPSKGGIGSEYYRAMWNKASEKEKNVLAYEMFNGNLIEQQRGTNAVEDIDNLFRNGTLQEQADFLNTYKQPRAYLSTKNPQTNEQSQIALEVGYIFPGTGYHLHSLTASLSNADGDGDTHGLFVMDPGQWLKTNELYKAGSHNVYDGGAYWTRNHQQGQPGGYDWKVMSNFKNFKNNQDDMDYLHDRMIDVARNIDPGEQILHDEDILLMADVMTDTVGDASDYYDGAAPWVDKKNARNEAMARIIQNAMSRTSDPKEAREAVNQAIADMFALSSSDDVMIRAIRLMGGVEISQQKLQDAVDANEASGIDDHDVGVTKGNRDQTSMNVLTDPDYAFSSMSDSPSGITKDENLRDVAGGLKYYTAKDAAAFEAYMDKTAPASSIEVQLASSVNTGKVGMEVINAIESNVNQRMHRWANYNLIMAGFHNGLDASQITEEKVTSLCEGCIKAYNTGVDERNDAVKKVYNGSKIPTVIGQNSEPITKLSSNSKDEMLISGATAFRRCYGSEALSSVLPGRYELEIGSYTITHDNTVEDLFVALASIERLPNGFGEAVWGSEMRPFLIACHNKAKSEQDIKVKRVKDHLKKQQIFKNSEEAGKHPGLLKALYESMTYICGDRVMVDNGIHFLKGWINNRIVDMYIEGKTDKNGNPTGRMNAIICLRVQSQFQPLLNILAKIDKEAGKKKPDQKKLDKLYSDLAYKIDDVDDGTIITRMILSTMQDVTSTGRNRDRILLEILCSPEVSYETKENLIKDFLDKPGYQNSRVDLFAWAVDDAVMGSDSTLSDRYMNAMKYDTNRVRKALDAEKQMADDVARKLETGEWGVGEIATVANSGDTMLTMESAVSMAASAISIAIRQAEKGQVTPEQVAHAVELALHFFGQEYASIVQWQLSISGSVRLEDMFTNRKLFLDMIFNGERYSMYADGHRIATDAIDTTVGTPEFLELALGECKPEWVEGDKITRFGLAALIRKHPNFASFLSPAETRIDYVEDSDHPTGQIVRSNTLNDAMLEYEQNPNKFKEKAERDRVMSEVLNQPGWLELFLRTLPEDIDPENMSPEEFHKVVSGTFKQFADDWYALESLTDEQYKQARTEINMNMCSTGIAQFAGAVNDAISNARMIGIGENIDGDDVFADVNYGMLAMPAELDEALSELDDLISAQQAVKEQHLSEKVSENELKNKSIEEVLQAYFKNKAIDETAQFIDENISTVNRYRDYIRNSIELTRILVATVGWDVYIATRKKNKGDIDSGLNDLIDEWIYANAQAGFRDNVIVLSEIEDAVFNADINSPEYNQMFDRIDRVYNSKHNDTNFAVLTAEELKEQWTELFTETNPGTYERTFAVRAFVARVNRVAMETAGNDFASVNGRGINMGALADMGNAWKIMDKIHESYTAHHYPPNREYHGGANKIFRRWNFHNGSLAKIAANGKNLPITASIQTGIAMNGGLVMKMQGFACLPHDNSCSIDPDPITYEKFDSNLHLGANYLSNVDGQIHPIRSNQNIKELFDAEGGTLNVFSFNQACSCGQCCSKHSSISNISHENVKGELQATLAHIFSTTQEGMELKRKKLAEFGRKIINTAFDLDHKIDRGIKHSGKKLTKDEFVKQYKDYVGKVGDALWDCFDKESVRGDMSYRDAYILGNAMCLAVTYKYKDGPVRSIGVEDLLNPNSDFNKGVNPAHQHEGTGLTFDMLLNEDDCEISIMPIGLEELNDKIKYSIAYEHRRHPDSRLDVDQTQKAALRGLLNFDHYLSDASGDLFTSMSNNMKPLGYQRLTGNRIARTSSDSAMVKWMRAVGDLPQKRPHINASLKAASKVYIYENLDKLSNIDKSCDIDELGMYFAGFHRENGSSKDTKVIAQQFAGYTKDLNDGFPVLRKEAVGKKLLGLFDNKSDGSSLYVIDGSFHNVEKWLNNINTLQQLANVDKIAVPAKIADQLVSQSHQKTYQTITIGNQKFAIFDRTDVTREHQQVINKYNKKIDVAAHRKKELCFYFGDEARLFNLIDSTSVSNEDTFNINADYFQAPLEQDIRPMLPKSFRRKPSQVFKITDLSTDELTKFQKDIEDQLDQWHSGQRIVLGADAQYELVIPNLDAMKKNGLSSDSVWRGVQGLVNRGIGVFSPETNALVGYVRNNDPIGWVQVDGTITKPGEPIKIMPVFVSTTGAQRFRIDEFNMSGSIAKMRINADVTSENELKIFPRPLASKAITSLGGKLFDELRDKTRDKLVRQHTVTEASSFSSKLRGRVPHLVTNNLYFSGQAMATSLALTLSPNGKWIVNQHIDQKYADKLRSETKNEFDYEFAEDVANGRINVFLDTAPNADVLNSAMRKVFRGYMRTFPSVSTRELFESHNFNANGEVTSFRSCWLDEPAYIFGSLNVDERSALFHELNPNICPAPGEEFDYSKHWVDPVTGKLRNTVKTRDGKHTMSYLVDGYIGPSSVWHKREGVGRVASSAALGLQASTTRALTGGLDESSIEDIADAIDLWADNRAWYEKKACEISNRVSQNTSYLPVYDSNLDLNQVDVLKMSNTRKRQYYIKENAHNYDAIRIKITKFKREIKWKSDKGDVSRLCAELGNAMGMNTDPTPEMLANAFKRKIGWSYNKGNNSDTFKLSELEDAVCEMGRSFNKPGKVFFIEGQTSKAGVFSTPAMTPTELRQWWDYAGEGSAFQRKYGTFEDFRNAMYAEQTVADGEYTFAFIGNQSSMKLAKDRNKFAALNSVAEYNLKAWDEGTFPDMAPRYISTEMTTAEAYHVHQSTLGIFLDAEQSGYSDEIWEHYEEGLKELREKQRRESQKTTKHVDTNNEPSGRKTIARTDPRHTKASYILKTTENAIKLCAVLNPILALASGTESGIRIGMMDIGMRTGAIGGTKWKKLISPKDLAEITKDPRIKSMMQALSDFDLLADYQDKLDFNSGESLEDQIDNLIKKTTGADHGGVSGFINKSTNKALKGVNLEWAFARKNGELAIARFLQICQEENITEMTMLDPETGEPRVKTLLLADPTIFFREVTDPANKRVYQAWDRALNASHQTSMNRTTLTSMLLSALFRKYPGLSFLNSVFASPFYQYGTNVTEKMINMVAPVSSVKYILVDKLKGDPFFDDLGVHRVQVHPSLTAALASDALKLSAFAMMIVLTGFANVTPPDDDDHKSDWREYMFFGVRPRDLSWWAEDLLCVPMIQAAFLSTCLEGKPNLSVLINGMVDIAYANPAMSLPNIVDTVLNPDMVEDQWNEEADRWKNSEGGSPEFWDQLVAQTAWGGMHMLTNMFTPSFAKTIYRSDVTGDKEYSYKQVWSKEAIENKTYLEDYSYSEQDTVLVGYGEAMKRKYAMKSPVMGLVLDLISPSQTTAYSRGGGLFGKAAQPKTQYSDPESHYYANKYSVMEEVFNETTGQSEWKLKDDQQLQETAYNVLSILEQYDDMDELRSKGFAINSQTQYYVALELQKTIKQSSNDWYEWSNSEDANPKVLGGGDWTAGAQVKQEAKEKWQAYQDHLYELKDKLYSEPITKGVQKYWRENTTYARDDKGNWYATGSNVRDGWGLQLLPVALGDTSEEKTVGYSGQWATRSAVNPEQSTGERVLIPINKYESIDKDAINEEAEKLTNSSSSSSSSGNKSSSSGTGTKSTLPAGGYKSYRSGGGGGYRSYGGYSGGSSSYTPATPKIYSTMPSSRYSNAASINPTRLYGADHDYLRPSFETKGSREAYKREDF